MISQPPVNLVQALIRLDRVNRYRLYNVPRSLWHLFRHDHVSLYEDEASDAGLRELDAFILAHLLELNDGFRYNLPAIPCRKLLIFHDLIPVILWEKILAAFPQDRFVRYFTRLSRVQDFDCVLANSRTTQADLVRLLGIPHERTRVIYAGLSPDFLQPASQEITGYSRIAGNAITKPYILSVLSFNFNKNIPGLFASFRALPRPLRDSLCLVLVCRMSSGEERALRRLWCGLGLPDRDLVLTGFVEPDVLVSLYDRAGVIPR